MIVKWKREGTTTTKSRLNRPRLMIDRDRQALKVVHKTCQTSSETITHEFCSAMNYPASTMGEQLHIKQTISPVNAKRRLKWYKEQCHWAVDNWKRVIWSEESHYTIWRSDWRVWV
jgi:hypothetical protein